MTAITLDAMAKINLSLDVLRERADGYHDLRMVMQSVLLHDTVKIEMQAQPGIRLRMKGTDQLPEDSRNIAWRAARRMLDAAGSDAGVSIEIEKRIPAAAGMAGGSTDCAAVLRGMNELLGLGMSLERLMEEGAHLGADVPFCILRRTALAEGIGQILTPAPPLPDCSILLAKPPVSVSTAHVYQNLVLDGRSPHPDVSAMLQALEKESLAEAARNMGNILETVTIVEHPVIAGLKAAMMREGALGSLMSGSGPTVFGLFEEDRAARQAGEVLSKEYPDTRVILTRPCRIQQL